jgi:hypothetical protein
MSDTLISGDVQELARWASIGELSLTDAGQAGRLQYALMRLSTVGLTEQDQEELQELGRLAIQELDQGVEQVASQITNRESAHPLAVAIANTVRSTLHGGEGGLKICSTRMAMVGAVFGAYVGLGDSSGVMSVLGAMAGATALCASKVLNDQMEWNAWTGFIRKD